ncbi:MAG: alpha-glucan family phosphorylase [Gemmatimonadetes bacterium]|nr:alpha-glucan family phosphorylase [Gemmatimonadota bacterium]
MTESPTRIPHLPERIAGLAGIATNLAWSWQREARHLFREIDEVLWDNTRHNPLELLARVDPARLQQCAGDPEFVRRYDDVRALLERAVSGADTWYARSYPGLGDRPIAYFCAEFGLHNSVPIYSGGLGVLSGDSCKAASDLGVPFVGVGLFYTSGYFDQRLRSDGRQEEADEPLDPAMTPLTPILGPNGEPHVVVVRMSDRPVHIGAWRILVGRVPVYLLDTTLESNHPEDRKLSHRLYAGGPEMRLRQEWLLGVGGVQLLRALGIDPAAFHANEGHTAFMLLERVRELTSCGMPFPEAVRRIRATSIFTTHTPVPAGHDVFTHDQIERCVGPCWNEMRVDRETFFHVGHHPTLDRGLFHMTALAIRLAGRVVGVSRLHGGVTRRMWQILWPGREPDQVPIGHVTNGAHLATWMSRPMKILCDEHLGPGWQDGVDDPALWEKMLRVDDARLWAAHLEAKAQLLEFIREEARRRWREGLGEVAHFVGSGTLLNPAALTIGFARRFAVYKRADLIFRDGERLRRLLANARRPVQIVFAGKAHPADERGKEMLRKVYSFTRDPRFEGRIAFLEDYELHAAHRLVQGADLWLSVPRVSMEACGTSGMKAALNGVPMVSTLDGWWAEGYAELNGWAIPQARPEEDADAVDAERLYRILEEEVVPLFYERDERGIPVRWVQRMKHALCVAGQRFTARRAVQEYVRKYYIPAIRSELGPGDPPTV